MVADVTPAKTGRQQPLQPPVEHPTNADLMSFMIEMKTSQEATINSRLDAAEARLANIGEQTSTTLDTVESRLEAAELSDGNDKQACSKVSALEKSVKDQMDSPTRQLKEVKTRPAPTMSPSRAGAPTSFTSAQELEPLGNIGGFDQETPRGVLEQAWAEHMRPRTQAFFDTTDIDVRAPYMLSSQLVACISGFSQACAS